MGFRRSGPTGRPPLPPSAKPSAQTQLQNEAYISELLGYSLDRLRKVSEAAWDKGCKSASRADRSMLCAVKRMLSSGALLLHGLDSPWSLVAAACAGA